ncbi:putative methyltransferase [Helianthus annuus]|uniref:Methyltransferase n=1 Tax=Helianthus annuus TaxID=4232 RepID=A0A251UWL5_HELAN|nr:putative methyltransferase [Helianthus annuus]
MIFTTRSRVSHPFISKRFKTYRRSLAPLSLSLSRDFTRSMKFQQIDEDSDLLVPISGFYWLYFIPNFSSLSSSFLRRAISIFKRLLIGLLRSTEKSCNGEEVQLRLLDLRSPNPNTVKLLDLVCLYAGWGILISGHFRLLFYLYRKLKVQCLDHSIDLKDLVSFVFRVNTVNEYASFVLKDVVRTKTYLNIFCKNKFLFKEKIVLDVGAGTGILSLFCAKAGAKHVYAIECSQMADMAPEIVKGNGFSNVEVVNGGKDLHISATMPCHAIEPGPDSVGIFTIL